MFGQKIYRGRVSLRNSSFLLLSALATGCASMPQTAKEKYKYDTSAQALVGSASSIQHVAHQEVKGQALQTDGKQQSQVGSPQKVDDWVQYAISRNPRLGKATFAIDAAQGKYTQAGLYPNPVLAVNGDELGDRTGPSGIWTAPQVTQEIVTGGKLSLSQAIVAKEVDQATLSLLNERYGVTGSVRSAFYDLYALERRIAVLDELTNLASEAVKTGQTLQDAKQVARLDVVQLEVELSRFKSQAEAARGELPGARKRLAALVGDPRISVGAVSGPFEEVPVYDTEKILEVILASHPEVRSARVGVERAQAAIKRAEVEPIPNVSLSTGYTYQGQNRSSDWLVGVSVPLPLWNRNQGNIHSAKAELGMAIQEVTRIENELADRAAITLRAYSAAMKLAEQYKVAILPKAEETYKLSLEAFKGGQFEYLRVIQAQRVISEARLEYNRALGDTWRAAADLSALLLEEAWPSIPLKPASPEIKAPGEKAQ